MKLTSLLLFVSVITFAANTYSQTTQFDLSLRDASIVQVLEEIERVTEFGFLFKSDQLDADARFTLNLKGVKIESVMDELLDDNMYSYKIMDKIIVISKDDSKPQEKKQVTGKVTDTEGLPLPGVTIIEKGTSNGTVTEADGEFVLNNVAESDVVLQFSFIGMKTREVVIGDQLTISVMMESEAFGIEEVVAIGYGVQKKSVLTSAISKVEQSELNLGNPTNVQNALKGKVSGIQITSQSGQPGAGAKIRIRGTGTVNNSDPLFIVDGMPSSNGIDYLNPSDIESIEILKDAASAAIYGARGANGVVLVTTKGGKKMTTPTLNYEFTYGIQNPERKSDLLSSEEYQSMMNEMAENSGKAPYFPATSSVNTDWQDELTYHNAPIVNHKLSISGGGETDTYYISLGNIQQSGILAKGYADYERFNGRLNYSNTLINNSRNFLSKVVLGSIVSYSRTVRTGNTINNSEATGIIASMNMLPPTEPIYQDNAEKLAYYSATFPNYVTSPDGQVYNIIDLREINNPFASLLVNNNQRSIPQVFNANFSLDVTLLKDLKYKTTGGFEWGFNSIKNAIPVYDLNTTTKNTISRIEDQKTQSKFWQWENTLSYNHSFGLHNLGLLAGTSMSSYEFSNLAGTDYDLLVVDPDKAFIDIATGDRSLERVSGYGSDHRLASVFGRVNYNYDEKYLLEAVVRRDGSSNFGPSHKYAVFPSVSLGWVISKETFMESTSSWLDFAKITASWGQNGNESIGAFGYTSMMSMGYNAVVDGKVYTGAKTSGYVNSNLKWETSEQTNLGLNLRFLESALTFSADYFVKDTKDMLLNVSLPEYTGFYSMKVNSGSVKNEGVEFESTYKIKIGSLNFNVGANASYVKNTVTDIGPGRIGLDILGGGLGGTVTWMESGKPYGFFYGYVHDGIFQNQAEVDAYVTENGALKQPNAKPGDVRYKDLDGKNGITGEDRTMIGDPNPKWAYGLNLTAEWKNFDLHAFFQGLADVDLYKFYRRTNITYANWDKTWLGRWHGEGTSDWMPRLVEGDPNNNTTWVSNLFIEDGSYLRLKVLQLGYQLPESLLNKAYIKRLRLFVQGENLFTLTNYTGLDPEVGTRNGFDGGTYPQARTFTFGANITF